MDIDIQVGDRVTYKFVKTGTIVTSIVDGDAYLEDLKNRDFIKILKIERPEYGIVEETKEILSKEEKEYLWNIIKPFKDKVNGIIKNSYSICEEFIVISIKNESNLLLPCFVKGTMYKGMIADKKYELKELGLEGD